MLKDLDFKSFYDDVDYKRKFTITMGELSALTEQRIINGGAN